MALGASLAFVAATHGDIETKNFDLTVKPQDDFNLYVNGGWVRANPIPAANSIWGAFYEVDEHNRQALHRILERAAKAGDQDKIEKLVGDFYASGMDLPARDTAALAPLQPELDAIAAIKTPADLQSAIARQHRFGTAVAFTFTSEQDPKQSTMVIAANEQGGLGLPDRDYYLRDDEKSQTLRTAYAAHVARLFVLAGDSPDVAKTESQAVLKLETALAKVSKTRVQLRDPNANYHKMSVAELQKLTPHFDWTAYFKAIGLAAPGDIDVGQPEFLQGFDRELAETSLEEWRIYLRWHLLHRAAPLLSTAIVNENFEFYGKTLTGTPELRELWKRVLGSVDTSVGEALGQLYVAENFPPEAKARMLALVENLRSALRDRIQSLDWMDDITKARALEKLNAFRVKIGYPDKWIDYSQLVVDRRSFAMNVLRASDFNFQRKLSKIGKPVDRGDWEMTPPTVNAYYNPPMNEIVFPAGILQPPFFDAKADDAVNYGGIGAVIGHEMTHGFDDQGRQYDAKGNLADWWTPESDKRFKERAAGIVKQFSGYTAIDDLKVNGALTQGENIADLGGLKIAYAAFQKAMAGKPREKIDGFTPDQRFFLSWATVWRTSQREAAMRLQVNTDPHSPANFRVNGPLSNLDEFYEAFGIPEGSPMRRAKADRVSIW
jgi:predicted metalloendopeptidase